jgi:hypothetical protein
VGDRASPETGGFVPASGRWFGSEGDASIAHDRLTEECYNRDANQALNLRR